MEQTNEIDGYTLEERENRLTYTITPEEDARQISNSLQRIMDEKNKMRVPQYTYDYVYGEVNYGRKIGLLGNQLPGGMRIDGGVNFSLSGGPTSSVSVAFSVGPVASVGISFGQVVSGVTGYFLRFPDSIHYYKAYNDKKIKVQQVAVYGTPVAGGARRFLYYVYPSSDYSWDVYAVRQ